MDCNKGHGKGVWTACAECAAVLIVERDRLRELLQEAERFITDAWSQGARAHVALLKKLRDEIALAHATQKKEE